MFVMVRAARPARKQPIIEAEQTDDRLIAEKQNDERRDAVAPARLAWDSQGSAGDDLQSEDNLEENSEPEPELEPNPEADMEVKERDVDESRIPVLIPSLRWSVEEFTDAEVVGWVTSSTEPSRRCIVALKENGRILAEAVASRFRLDLKKAGIGDGRYGFSIPMPKFLLEGAEHILEVVELDSGVSLTPEARRWRSTMGTASSLLRRGLVERNNHERMARGMYTSSEACFLFDISDLVYYLGHHPNLTGIQRVQSSIVLAMIENNVVAKDSVRFLSFDAVSRRWVVIPTEFLVSLLRDLFQPESDRSVSFVTDKARHGVLPGAVNFHDETIKSPSVLCLLGAAWVQRDYFHRVAGLKRRLGTKFVMMVHDLIPIYARETCDQGTALVFEEFLIRALRHVDQYLSVSENTARDLRRYIAAKGLPEPSVTVTCNGSSFDEFLNVGFSMEDDLPDRFVLFVSTIEGRKNHRFIFDIWRRLVAERSDAPHLICVGRVGWRAQDFLTNLVETDYLDGKVVLLQEISDAYLKLLYSRCLFTVFPSLYEGWGLPVGESLAAGKICVCSDRASLPEVAGPFGIYINIDDPDLSYETIVELISNNEMRRETERAIQQGYEPISWETVAQSVLAGCRKAIQTGWVDPYPYPLVPYSTEISFSALGRGGDGSFGDTLLERTAEGRKGHFLRVPLHERNFLIGEDMRASGAWAEPEAWGTWMCYRSAELCGGFEPSESTYFYVFLRLRRSGPVSDSQVRVFWDRDVVWEGIMGDQPRNVAFRLRRKVQSTTAGWKLRLRIEVQLPDEMLEAIAAVDSRVPTIGVERLVVVPEHDLKTRLDIMTDIMLSSY